MNTETRIVTEEKDTIYVLPEISIAVPKNAMSAHSSLTYSYSMPTNTVAKSKWNVFTGISGMVIGFFVGLVLFAIPAVVGTVVVTQTLNNHNIMYVQTQEVPTSKTPVQNIPVDPPVVSAK